MPGTVLQKTDMSQDLTKEATKRIQELMDQLKDPKRVGSQLKQEFDKMHGRAWHCVVGRDFHSFISYEKGTFLDVACGDYNFILFKSGSA
ncbi:hypothetical protein AHF37_04697 [Paragonimus kellicotti]|nr:hypothetical protein AHF37_04697 [Paragonimus kellicotti]